MPPLSDAERDIHDAGLISVLKDLHDEIDGATFARLWLGGLRTAPGRQARRYHAVRHTSRRPGSRRGGTPLSRLVTLNLERQAEEKQGLVRMAAPRIPDSQTRPQGIQTRRG